MVIFIFLLLFFTNYFIKKVKPKTTPITSKNLVLFFFLEKFFFAYSIERVKQNGSIYVPSNIIFNVLKLKLNESPTNLYSEEELSEEDQKFINCVEFDWFGKKQKKKIIKNYCVNQKDFINAIFSISINFFMDFDYAKNIGLNNFLKFFKFKQYNRSRNLLRRFR
jgi:hypothetical protein